MTPAAPAGAVLMVGIRAPFEPARSGLACRDGRRFEMVVFSRGAPLAAALDALMRQADEPWLRASAGEMVALLGRWRDLATGRWPGDACAMLDALLSRSGRFGRDLDRFGLTVTRCDTDRGPGVDVRRGRPVRRPRRTAARCVR